MKSKLVRTFSRVTKRSWPPVQCSSKVRPRTARNVSGSGSFSYSSVHHQDLQNPSSSSMQKVAALSTTATKQTSYGCFDYVGGGGGDENVDMKATDFIFYVRE
ncbi:hypothetical protein ACOSP7_018726 [Xanthoceras sorbifolium]